MHGNGKEAHSIISESVVIVDSDGNIRDKFGMGRLRDGKGSGLILLDQDGTQYPGWARYGS